MAKNQGFSLMLDALVFDSATQDLKNDALEALMKADDATKFRQALITHQAILCRAEDLQLYENADAGDDNFLHPDGFGDTPATNKIEVLRQKAAKKRMEFGLQHSQMELGDLIAITREQDPANLRNLLEAKPAIFGGLADCYQWRDVHNPLLAPEALREISAQACPLAMGKILAILAVAERKNNAINDAITSTSRNIQAATIPGIRAELERMFNNLDETRQFIEQHQDFRNLDSNRAANQDLERRYALMEQKFTELKAVLKQKSITFVASQYGLYNIAIEELDLASATSIILEAKRNTVKAHLEAITTAVELGEICFREGEPTTAFDDMCNQRDDVQRQLINLQIHYNYKLVIEITNQIATKINDISQEDSAQRRSTMVGDAEAHLRAARNAIEEAQRAKAFEDFDDLYDGRGAEITEFDRLITLANAAVRTATENLEPVKTWVNLPPAPLHFGNAFWQRGGVLDEFFTDEVVVSGSEAPAGVIKGSLDPLSAAFVNSAAGAVPIPRNEVKFRPVQLNPGDYIYSTALFSKPPTAGRPAPAQPETVKLQLVLDHTGKVIDKTTDRLDEQQSVIKALKHAELLLSNYNPAAGDTILITGDSRYVAQANRVLAALLLLKENYPALKQVKIKSAVVGCDAPQPIPSRFFSLTAADDQDSANRRFIDRYLPESSVSKVKQESLQEEVSKFTQVKEARSQGFNEIKQQLRVGRMTDGGIERPLTAQEKIDKARFLSESGFKAEEEIDLDGTISPVRA